jgi:hypothetical protein
MRKIDVLMVATLALATACQGAPIMVAEAPVAPPPATMALDVAPVEQALIDSRTVDWSSRTFASPRLLEAQQRLAAKQSGYRVAAAAWPSAAVWTRTGLSQISNAVAYAFNDPVWATGPNPMPGDRLMVMSNTAKGSGNNFFVLNPVTGATLNGAGWNAMASGVIPGGSRVDQSALTLSTKGTQAMFVTTNGYFGAISTANGAQTAAFQLGTNQQTVRSAPFVNNSAAPGLDDHLQVWCATTNAATTVGQLHRLDYNKAAGTPWTYSGALQVRGPAADGSAGTITAAGFKASPVAWMGKVYIGDVLGRLWEYDITSGAARYWDMSPFAGLGSDMILAPVAIDIGAGGAVTHVFVACGARVFWIDPVTEAMTPSQNLLVDTATNTPGPKLQGSLNGYTFTGTNLAAIQAADSISCGPYGSGFDNDNDNFGNEIVGSFHINPGDNRPVTGYVRFNIPANYFSGRMPVSATLTMTIDNYTVPDTSDAGSIYRASTFLSSNTLTRDTTTQWTSNNMNANNQPRLLVPNPFSQRNGPARPDGTPYDWNVAGAVPRDNTSYSFAMRGSNKVYYGTAGAPNAAPGYYGAFYGTNATQRARRPRLTVRVANTGLRGPVLGQPVLLALSPNPKLYVANSNTLFELDYTDPGRFGNAAETYFSLTTSGRGGGGNAGVIDGGLKHYQNAATAALGSDGANYYAYVCDENGLGVPHLNKYRLPLNRAANADSLTHVFNLPSGSLGTTPYVTWDYFNGSLYFASQGVGSTVYRLKQ